MLLQSLVKLYETLAQKGEIEKSGWSPVKISYGLCLDNDGNIDKIIFLKQKTSDGKKEIPKPISLPMPVKRSSGVASNFLYENSTYLLVMIHRENLTEPQRHFRLARKNIVKFLKTVTAMPLCQ